VIINEIKRLAAGGRAAIDVVDSLEEQRLRAKSSLSYVINALEAAAKARGKAGGLDRLDARDSI
jgi:hypothetical protein